MEKYFLLAIAHSNNRWSPVVNAWANSAEDLATKYPDQITRPEYSILILSRDQYLKLRKETLGG